MNIGRQILSIYQTDMVQTIVEEGVFVLGDLDMHTRCSLAGGLVYGCVLYDAVSAR